MSRRRIVVAAVAVACTCAAMFAARRLDPPRPSLLFVLVDTLRADRVGTRSPSLTPFLDRLAVGSWRFTHAYAPSSWTIPSIASLCTGREPFEHGVLDFGIQLGAHDATLAEVLHAHGFDTAALFTTGLLGGSGFERGFDTFRLVGHPDINTKPDAAELNDAALAWLDHRDAARPFFLYLHYMEPHYPYRAHDGITAPRAPGLATPDAVLGWRTASGAHLHDARQQRDAWHMTAAERGRLNDLYDGEVAHLDRALEALFARLAARGALADTIVVVTADHGEEFGEHGLYAHGVSLYEPAIRVPLLVRLPGDRPGGTVDRPVATAGIARALLDVLAIASPTTFTVAAVPLRATPDDSGGPVLSELGPITGFTIWRHRAAAVDGARKLLIGSDDALEVHDLHDDPEERDPSPPTGGDRQLATSQALALPPSPAADDRRRPSDEMRARLQALGYVGSPPPPDP